jgi:hypothetical protein
MSQIESFGLLGIGIFMFTIFPLLSSTFVRAVEVMFELITGIRLL